MRASEDIARVDSETGIIATLFRHPEFSFYSEDLLPNHFTNRENRCIYQAICALARDGITTIDPYNIIQMLSSSEATRHLAVELSVEQLYSFIDNATLLSAIRLKSTTFWLRAFWTRRFAATPISSFVSARDCASSRQRATLGSESTGCWMM